MDKPPDSHRNQIFDCPLRHGTLLLSVLCAQWSGTKYTGEHRADREQGTHELGKYLDNVGKNHTYLR